MANRDDQNELQDNAPGYCIACGELLNAEVFCAFCSTDNSSPWNQIGDTAGGRGASPLGWPMGCRECGAQAPGYHLCCTGYLCLLCYQLHEITAHGVPGSDVLG